MGCCAGWGAVVEEEGTGLGAFVGDVAGHALGFGLLVGIGGMGLVVVVAYSADVAEAYPCNAWSGHFWEVWICVDCLIEESIEEEGCL